MSIQEIRPFIPSRDYDASIAFYQALGFSMESVTEDMVLFNASPCYFFLYRAAPEEVVRPQMFQLVVSDLQALFETVESQTGIVARYEPIREERWGKVFYLWGPSGEMWHVTEFRQETVS